jgi:hypothetical protein
MKEVFSGIRSKIPIASSGVPSKKILQRWCQDIGWRPDRDLCKNVEATQHWVPIGQGLISPRVKL